MDHSGMGEWHFERHMATPQQKRALNEGFGLPDGTAKCGRDLSREELLQVIGDMLETIEDGYRE